MNGLLRGLNGPRGMVAASRQSTPDQQKEAPRYSPASIVLVLQSRFLTLGFVGGVAELANAETWNQNHPRRAEVNARLANQNHRVNDELREGEMTRGQARTLHA